jgi:hypothetical protein
LAAKIFPSEVPPIYPNSLHNFRYDLKIYFNAI